jgi:hypothetical protein
VDAEDDGLDHEQVTKLYRQIQNQLLGGSVGALMAGVWGVETWLAFGRLERGEVQLLWVWSPVAHLYELGGRWLGMLPFVLVILLSAAICFKAASERRAFRAQVGQATLRQALIEERRRGSPFLQGVDNAGRVPVTTWFLAVILVVMLAATALWVALQR